MFTTTDRQAIKIAMSLRLCDLASSNAFIPFESRSVSSGSPFNPFEFVSKTSTVFGHT
jgi:hypothetical protein